MTTISQKALLVGVYILSMFLMLHPVYSLINSVVSIKNKLEVEDQIERSALFESVSDDLTTLTCFDSNPGSGFDVSVLNDWKSLPTLVKQHEGSKLLLLVRHGEGVHNQLQQAAKRRLIYLKDNVFNFVMNSQNQNDNRVDTLCGQIEEDFDARLTTTGIQQATLLGLRLKSYSIDEKFSTVNLFDVVTKGLRVSYITSPMFRAMHTAHLCFRHFMGAKDQWIVEETCREQVKWALCDARPVVERVPGKKQPQNICADQDITLRQRIKDVFGRDQHLNYSPATVSDRLGMFDNQDPIFHSDGSSAESWADVGKRADLFLGRVFGDERLQDSQVVVVATHSHFISALLYKVGREYYAAENGEIVPVVVRPIST